MTTPNYYRCESCLSHGYDVTDGVWHICYDCKLYSTAIVGRLAGRLAYQDDLDRGDSYAVRCAREIDDHRHIPYYDGDPIDDEAGAGRRE